MIAYICDGCGVSCHGSETDRLCGDCASKSDIWTTVAMRKAELSDPGRVAEFASMPEARGWWRERGIAETYPASSPAWVGPSRWAVQIAPGGPLVRFSGRVEPPSDWDPVAAEKARDDAIAKADAWAPRGWRNAALNMTQRVCRDQEHLTTDDIQKRLAGMGIPEPHEPRAWGGVMAAARARKWCEPDGSTKQSEKAACHRRPKRVWRSLIYSPPHGET